MRSASRSLITSHCVKYVLAAAVHACVLACLRPACAGPAPITPGGKATAAAVVAGRTWKAGAPIARLDGEPISLEDVQAEIAFQVYRRQVDIYSLLKRATEELVERRLLAREASRRGVTVEELLRSEVDEAVEPVGDAEIDAYLEENPEGAGEPDAHERVRYYLDETRKIRRRLKLLADLRARASFEFLIDPPEQPRVHLSLDGAPARGPADAPITLVHFATFSSPRSARSVAFVKRLYEEFPGTFRWVHRNFPNERDEVGLMAAQLAVEAQRKGRFWQLHDRLFGLEGRLTPADLQSAASDLDLTPVAPGETTELSTVKRDIDAGVRAGITREPVLFVNGRYFSGTFPFEKLRAMVQEELGQMPPGSDGHD